MKRSSYELLLFCCNAVIVLLHCYRAAFGIFVIQMIIIIYIGTNKCSVWK